MHKHMRCLQDFDDDFTGSNTWLDTMIRNETSVGLPVISSQSGIGVITFLNEWQIKLLWQPKLATFFDKYFTLSVAPYRLILRMGAITNLTLTDLKCLVDNFVPVIVNDGVLVACEVQPNVERLMTTHMLNCVISLRADLDSAIDFVRSVSD